MQLENGIKGGGMSLKDKGNYYAGGSNESIKIDGFGVMMLMCAKLLN